ncbi:lipopeptide [Halomonas sp. DQ26W]|uniref:LPS translocon maturation chaperone LptM n=1 Tax=Halomonas sp. DQ26W TaxID=2282311 RepID=UPI000DF76ADC|nr:lipoprotein [Halomonas sp. DQ26W]RDB42182.1 lipopeptide [Halomonas sp. DQ26W]
MKRQPTLAVLMLATLMLLAGCGQKGPLYQPDDEQAAERYGSPASSVEANSEDES